MEAPWSCARTPLFGGTVYDDGAVVCRAATGTGVGGACIAWNTLLPSEDSLAVVDELSLDHVAYQVCVDVNGDGLCGYNPNPFPCGQDRLYFSHGDNAQWFNPIGPLITSMPVPGCGGFEGWIVFLCEGVHDDFTGPHAHPASAGTVTPTLGGTGFGNFCGPQNGELDPSFPPKPYFIV